MRNITFLLYGCILFVSCANTSKAQDSEISILAERPKLVVGIVVDQMRYDYIERYWDLYEENGFKRLINKGTFCRNHNFSYAPTCNGTGHAEIYTGTTPAYHGIISNDWYDREGGVEIYCASDTNCIAVGTVTSAGQMSPKNMLVTTITDELELFTNRESKTIGISMKDRGAVMPAGHIGDAAYWFVGGDEGNWVSSSHYMDELPDWVSEFNNNGMKDEFLAGNWDLLLEREKYDLEREDNNPYEAPFTGTLRPAFPYNLAELKEKNGNYSLLKGIPQGNTLTTEFAIRAIIAEELGKDKVTDLLAISYSAPDYVGHQFGPGSMEVQDTYLRLDRDIAALLKKLDEEVGEENYLVFFTADHGAVRNPGYLKEMGIPAGHFRAERLLESVKNYLNSEYGEGNWIENYSNEQIFINRQLIKEKGVNQKHIEQEIADIALGFDGVFMTATRHQLHPAPAEGLMKKIAKGHSQKRSGDVILILKPGWLSFYSYTGTSHGSPYSYDTHVPLIFYGWKVPQKSVFEPTFVEDIAPTIASFLKIQTPNGTTGNTIVPLFKD